MSCMECGNPLPKERTKFCSIKCNQKFEKRTYIRSIFVEMLTRLNASIPKDREDQCWKYYSQVNGCVSSWRVRACACIYAYSNTSCKYRIPIESAREVAKNRFGSTKEIMRLIAKIQSEIRNEGHCSTRDLTIKYLLKFMTDHPKLEVFKEEFKSAIKENFEKVEFIPSPTIRAMILTHHYFVKIKNLPKKAHPVLWAKQFCKYWKVSYGTFIRRSREAYPKDYERKQSK